MGISDAVQTLSAAFSFGILLQAASGALFVYYRGHGSTILRDGRRLVLVLFLLFAALWAQIEFLNLLLPALATTSCQVTLVFSTAFDQLARVSVEQFLLWSVGFGTKVTGGRLLLQGILFLRMISGGVLVGFTRPDFAPACVARTSVLPVSIVVLVLDGIIVGWLMIRAMSLGMFRDMGDKSSIRQGESKALIFSLFGLTAWFGMSIPMILGIPSILLILRTVLPANGLLILVGIVTMFSGALTMNAEEIMTPEARSPFAPPMPPSREVFSNPAGNGSPITHTYTKSGGLFVVNPSSTPRDSPTTFQGSRGDARGFTKLAGGSTVTVRSLGVDEPESSKRGPGYRGSSGIFPSPLSQNNEGTFAPQIRAVGAGADVGLKSTITTTFFPVAASVAPLKRGIFGFGKAPPGKPSVRSLGISQPVMANPNDGNIQPFARMATIDLIQAAAMERERREGAAARSRLVANRPAPQPPTISTVEALSKTISVKRKEIGHRVPPFPVAPKAVESGNANTTSAELSPSREAVRRRSPNANTFDLNLAKKEIEAIALHRKPTLGLPSNPRAQRVTMSRPGKTQTVMFMNDLKYDDPAMVNSIEAEARKMSAAAKEALAAQIGEKSHWSSTVTLKSSTGSVIHRPRPVKRNLSKNDPSHRRSRSAGSMGIRKSVLMSAPGSPTKLPPLPPPPTSAANLKRLLQTDTKSMTFNEKIEFLFPAPPERVGHNRHSSVPSLSVPSVYMADTPLQSPTVEERTRSKRITVANSDIHDFDAANSLTVPESNNSVEQPKHEPKRETYRFSASTYRTLTEEAGAALVPTPPDMPPRQVSTQSSALSVPKRRSIYDEIQRLRNSVQPKPYVPEQAIIREASKVEKDKRQGPVLKFEAEGQEIMTMMLDTEQAPESFLSIGADGNEMSFFLDAEQSFPGKKPREPTWHRRIGDELPTFSGRKSAASVRKMPPPTPLLLNRRGRAATVVVRHAEPSPPADSPSRAIEEIQKQLKRFEEPSRGSVGEILRNLPQGEEARSGGRAELLANLEREMGMQENQWQQNHANMDRDSMASIATPQQQTVPEPEPIESHDDAQQLDRTPSGAMSRRARIRSSMTIRPGPPEGSSSRSNSTSTDSSDDSSRRASIWQQRLANAQIEYLEKAPSLANKKTLNFLSVSKAKIGSPTPPDTESGTEFDSESENEIMQARSIAAVLRKPVETLWKAPVKSPKAATGRMWNLPYQRTIVQRASLEPPAKNVRPAQRRVEQALPIFSRMLWTKPRSTKRHSIHGLWGMKVVRPKSVATRRASLRPMRKSKRITFLPDILESPVALPNKDTLGIFQFPWGETSDQPVYHPMLNPVAAIAPIINSRLDTRSRELEPEVSEYSSSFFDDYDEEDDMDAESDDDFDETTLWEIANLLNPNADPSTMDLTPRGKSQIIEDYDNDSDYEEPSIVQAKEQLAPKIVSEPPIQPLTFSAKDDSKPRDKKPAVSSKLVANMWIPQEDNTVDSRKSLGMFTMPSGGSLIRTTKKAPAAIEMLKAPRQPTDEPPKISTRDMWMQPENKRRSIQWIARSNANCQFLWSPPKRARVVPSRGLFTVARVVTRTSDFAPAAINMTAKPRTSRNPLDVLTSSKLWSGCDNLPLERDWISESSVRPESPAFSTSSSGNTSPISDSSSVKSSLSTSTKASSIWNSAGSVRSMLPSWFDSKSSKKTPATSPIDDAARPSRIPTRQKSTKAVPLPGIRESRVLASRDLWEAKAPVLETPVRRWRRGNVAQKPDLPVAKPSRHQHRPLVVYRADWEAALAQAIAAGTPLVRGYAGKTDWESALAKAISLSKPRMQRPKCAPEMWKAALNEAVKRGRKPQYDSAILHPVFFTESLVSSTPDIHPAAIGHVSRKAAMWSAGASSVAPVSQSLWSKATVSPRTRPASFKAVELLRKPLMVMSLDLPILQSTDLWQSSQTTSVQRNWLTAKPSVIEIWAPSTPTKTRNVETGMWTARPSTTASSPDMFAHVKAQETKQDVRQAPLQLLNSTELFSKSPKAQNVTHWLHDTTNSAATTWSAPSMTTQATQITRMWESKLGDNQAPGSLFSNEHDYPWLRSTRDLTSEPLAEIKSTDMWRPSRELPQSPRNWLVSRRFSRVEFRY